jgi:hypothetical protein
MRCFSGDTKGKVGVVPGNRRHSAVTLASREIEEDARIVKLHKVLPRSEPRYIHASEDCCHADVGIHTEGTSVSDHSHRLGLSHTAGRTKHVHLALILQFALQNLCLRRAIYLYWATWRGIVLRVVRFCFDGGYCGA